MNDEIKIRSDIPIPIGGQKFKAAMLKMKAGDSFEVPDDAIAVVRAYARFFVKKKLKGEWMVRKLKKDGKYRCWRVK